MTTKELAQAVGVSTKTVLRNAKLLDGLPVGGRKGFVFPAKSPARLRAMLRRKHAARAAKPLAATRAKTKA